MDIDLQRALREVNKDPANPIGWVRGINFLNRMGMELPTNVKVTAWQGSITYYDTDAHYQVYTKVSLTRHGSVQWMAQVVHDEFDGMLQEFVEDDPEVYDLYHLFQEDPFIETGDRITQLFEAGLGYTGVEVELHEISLE